MRTMRIFSIAALLAGVTFALQANGGDAEKAEEETKQEAVGCGCGGGGGCGGKAKAKGEGARHRHGKKGEKAGCVRCDAEDCDAPHMHRVENEDGEVSCAMCEKEDCDEPHYHCAAGKDCKGEECEVCAGGTCPMTGDDGEGKKGHGAHHRKKHGAKKADADAKAAGGCCGTCGGGKDAAEKE